jgi:thioredoxin
VLDASGRVLVYVWKPGCTTCRLVTPLLREISPEQRERLKVYTIDLHEARDLLPRYGVHNIPALLCFEGGQVIAEKIGAVPRTAFRAFVGSLLEGGSPPDGELGR